MSKRRSKFLSLLFTALMVSTMIVTEPVSVQAANTAYYVDSVGGNDNNNGTGTSTPWKSLSKVNSTTFGPGDKIYLKAGSVWNSTYLYPKGSGANGNPIIIDMYGSGNKPVINCNGTNFAAVYIENQQYIEINNLEVTNDNDSTYGNNNTSHFLGIGLRINNNSGTFNHIYIKNCYIHNVDGDPGIADPTLDKSTGGIGACIAATSTANCGRFNDIKILNNKISYVSRTGIFMVASAKADNNPPYYSTNITISGNIIDHAAGDGIVNTQTNVGMVDHNVSTYGCHRNVAYSAGMWPWSCTDMTYQYNECSYIYNRGIGDLNAWDFDMYNRGTIIYQYNYSHSNAGGMMLTMGNGAQHSIVRYNISCNEPFTTANPSSETNYDLYNNVFYKDSGVLRPNRAYNNIFLNCSNINFANVNTNIHDYNCYYGGSSVSEPHSLYSDPKLVNPSEVDGIENLGGFKLQSDSPCINAGTPISGNGGKDFFGNAVYTGAPDIGAHEYQGTGGTSPVNTTSNYRIVNRNSGKSLGIDGGSTADGANICQYTYNGLTSRQWKFIDAGGGYYKIKNVNSGKLMDINGASTADGAFNIQWTDNGGNNQQWQLVDAGGGYYKIKNRNSGKVLDITGASTAEGARGIQWTDNGGNNQQWQFIAVSEGGTVTTWNDNNTGIAYTGSWSVGSDTGCYNGDYHSSNVLNDNVVISFTGTRAAIYGTKNDWIGMADIYVDDVKKATIDGYSATMAYQQLYYDTGVLPSGPHTVKLVVLHQKNPSGAEYYIDVDRIDITD